MTLHPQAVRRRRALVPLSASAPADEATAAAPRPVAERSLAGYLAMPRPKDLTKAALMPLVFCLGVLSAGGVGGEQLVRALVVLLVLELLVYPARYQWNDARGFVADQHHPDKAGRGRLPGPLDRAQHRVLTSCIVALARIGLAVALIFGLPGLHLGAPVTAVIVAVFGIAVVYEFLRGHATGRTGEVPRRCGRH